MDLITLGEVNKEEHIEDVIEKVNIQTTVKGQHPLDYTIENQNREPLPPEIAACSPHIDELILTESFSGVVYLGKVARTYKTRLPSIELYHPAYIGRMQFKLLTILRQSRILDKFVEKLHVKEEYEKDKRFLGVK
jgi:uracil-DNA glycosylase